jgi:hypothetical protein
MSEVNELVEFDKIASGVAGIQEQGNFLPDMTTKEGYEASKRFVLDVTTPTRTKLDKAHKKAKAYWSSGAKNVDNKKNEILEILVDIQKPHQEAYKEFDQIEKQKKAKFEDDIKEKVMAVYHFRTLPLGSNSDYISARIQECGETDTQDGFYHMAKEAAKERLESLEVLNELLMGAVAHEAEQQRQAELAEENRIRQIQIDEQQAKIDAQQAEMNAQQSEIEAKQKAQADAELKADQEKRQAEYDRKLKIENEERAKIDEINRKQQAIEREEYAKKQAESAVEQEKQAEINRQKSEGEQKRIAQEKLEANKAHTGEVHKKAEEFIMSFDIDEVTAKKLVIAISQKNELTLTINY